MLSIYLDVKVRALGTRSTRSFTIGVHLNCTVNLARELVSFSEVIIFRSNIFYSFPQPKTKNPRLVSSNVAVVVVITNLNKKHSKKLCSRDITSLVAFASRFRTRFTPLYLIEHKS